MIFCHKNEKEITLGADSAQENRGSRAKVSLKDSAFEELYDAIQELLKGNFYLTPSIARMYVDSNKNAFQPLEEISKSKGISKKEREVLQLVAEGLKTRDIALRLNLSVKTVESHRRNMMKKLSIFTIAGLTKFAIQEGMIAME